MLSPDLKSGTLTLFQTEESQFCYSTCSGQNGENTVDTLFQNVRCSLSSKWKWRV